MEPVITMLFCITQKRVHLWNEMWRLNDMNKSAKFEYSCLYERLKRMYLPEMPS